MYFRQSNRIASRKSIIVGSMIALYALIASNAVLGWYYTIEHFFTYGGSNYQIFLGPTYSPGVYTFSLIVNSGVTFIIADGVLVWRCFHASGQSIRRSALPIGLLILETALIICFNVVSYLRDYEPEIFHVLLTLWSATAILAGVMYVSIAATSLTATFMICRQVYTHTKPGSRSRRRYRNVIDASIQSSALYSIVLVVHAILNIIDGLPQFLRTTTRQNMYPPLLLHYSGTVLDLVTGIAPTLMVARLIVSSYNEDTEVSSFSFPKDLITHPASHSEVPQADNNNLEDTGTQTNQSLRIGEADGDSLISLISRHA
ncbi:hypothetical protein CPC08DRAFT_818828 [Agrocybe pediades]|nr:hypothetical protein CPC08DRAFT_818828 [Agrocybe pediades]